MLAIHDLSYRYANNPSATILDGISHTFASGCVSAILGPSGSGKTTLLSLLAGLDTPTGGEIVCEGQPVGRHMLARYRRDQVTLVFQHYNLIDYLTPVDNVMLGGVDRNDAMSLLDAVGLDRVQGARRSTQLSGGQQQRVAIARALARDTPVLLADEPTGNLDERTAGGIVDLLLAYAHERNRCVIVVTHSRDVAEAADTVLRLEDGRLRPGISA